MGYSKTEQNVSALSLIEYCEGLFKFVARMSSKTTNIHQFITSFPFVGILCFVLLYIYSSTLYPGGSQADLTSAGFDWVNNYWCNLMNVEGMNGVHNPARPFAIVAMCLLCLGLMVFFIQFASAFSRSKLWRLTIKVGAILSMSLAMLIFTPYHDTMTLLSSLFGLFVVVGVLVSLYKSDLLFYKISSVLCILLMGLNNCIYYSNHWIEALPLIQKITFATVLVWVVGLHTKVIQKLRQ